jgi:senataxin
LIYHLFRYFGAFSGEVLESFYSSFNKWELSLVINALSRAGLTSGTANHNSHVTLSNVPPAVVYHMVCNLDILQDTRILSIIHAYPPSDSLPGWPSDPPPAGILILTVDENAEVRQWAKNQISKCKIVPIPKEKLVGAYSIAMDAVAHAVSSRTQVSNSHISATMADGLGRTLATKAGALGSFSYATDPVDLWSGFSAFLRLVPPELLTSSSHHNTDLRRLVTGHLHDTGPRQYHFCAYISLNEF